jgi:hypothetical protein
MADPIPVMIFLPTPKPHLSSVADLVSELPIRTMSAISGPNDYASDP